LIDLRQSHHEILLFFSGLRYVCVTNAENIAIAIFYIGEDGVLSCPLSDVNIAWNFYPESRDRIHISHMNRLVDSSGKYAISGPNLTVTDVTFDDAGKYLCDSLDGPTHRRLRFNVTVQQRGN